MSFIDALTTDSRRIWRDGPSVNLYRVGVLTNRGTKRFQSVEFVRSIYSKSLRANFEAKTREWFEDTQWQSSIASMCAHHQFNNLVGMGEPILPLILEKMAAGDLHVHWFPLLKTISREDPVPLHARGFITEMANSWLSWGKQKNLISD